LAWPSQNHGLHLEKQALYSLLQFGKWIFLATLVTFLGGQGLQAIQGVLVSPETLGMLYIAAMFSGALRDLALQLYSSVVFPALSKTSRTDPQRFKSILNRFRLYLLALTVPGSIALSLASTTVINTLYDGRYAAAGPFLAISAITTAIGFLPMGYQNALLASGDSRAHFIIIGALTVLRIGGLATGFHVGGVEGMLLGTAIGTFFGYLISAAYARKMGWQSLSLDLTFIGIIAFGAYASLEWRGW
jgi:O-antigen/teichoic acid export membrane protein